MKKMKNNDYNNINENIISFKNKDMSETKTHNFSNYSESNNLMNTP